MTAGSKLGRRLSAVAALPLIAAGVVGTAHSVDATASHTSVAAPGHYSYQGTAYGTTVRVGTTVTSGPSAPVYLGCTDLAGTHLTNTSAGVDLSPLLKTGTVTTTADTFASPAEAKTTATTQNAGLLAGLITATAVRASSSTTATATGFALDSSGTSLLNLVVAGTPITITPAPNTRINLPGFGYVVLNEQFRHIATNSASLSVNAIHLHITSTNVLNIPTGTDVVVSHADSGLGGPVAGVLDGRAYGSSVTVGALVTSGPSFLEVMPCLGTSGQLRSNTGAGVNVPNALATGTITDTAQGTVTASSANGEMTSTVQSANVLAGLVNATVIKADAHAATDGTSFSFSDTGSQFLSLSVAGHPSITANVAPNTRLVIPGVGTLYLHRVIHTSNSIEVRMIELVLSQAVNGLPTGTDIRVAVAEASAH